MAKNPSNKNNSKKSKTSASKGKSKKVTSKAKSKKGVGKKATKPKVNRGLSLYIRVRSVLWTNFKKEYKGVEYSSSGSPFLKVVGQVYRECRSKGKGCPENVIIEKYQEIVGGEKRFEPFIDDELYGQANPYWEINNINWSDFEPYLWVISPMIIPSPHEFQVSDYLGVSGVVKKDGKEKSITEDGFDKYFKQWVDFCNEQARAENKGSRGDIPYWVMTKPKWNTKKKRWESNIYIISAGSEYDRESLADQSEFEGWKTDSYGFVPKGDVEEPKAPKKVVPPSVKKKKAPSKKKKAPIKKKTIAKESSSQILLNEKLGYIEEIKMWKEIGDKKEMADAVAKLKAVNKKISNLK